MFLLKKKIACLLLPALLFSCSNIAQQNKGAHIHGKIRNLASGTVFLEQYVTTSPKEISKTTIEKDGTFSIDAKIHETGFYRLSFATPEYKGLETTYVNLVLDSTGEINIQAEAPDIEKTYTVEGSEDSELLKNINTILKTSFAKIDSLSSQYAEAKTKKGIHLDSLSRAFEGPYNLIINEREDFIRDVILDHTSSIAILTAINYLDKNKDLDAYQLVDKALMTKYPGHPYIKDFHRKVEEIARLAHGAPAPEIMLNDPKGKEVKLSELKGKVVLVQFWASWNWPSRQVNPSLARIYKKNKDKGFEIVGVSLDKDKELWTKAIKEDKINWIQCSDLLSWDSQAAKSFDVRTLPFNYLVDDHGVIIDKGLKENELEAKLDELLKK